MKKSSKAANETFWGHLGIEFGGESREMWPISITETNHLEALLSSTSRRTAWIAVQTLNNRMLLINPTQWECICLLDDGLDWPEGGHVLGSGLDDYAGMPVEHYKRMAEWADGDSDFDGENPAPTQKEMLAAIERGGFLTNPSGLRALLRHTTIHYVSGKTRRYHAERSDLYELIEIEGDADAVTVKISQRDSVEHFYPLDKLRMIEIPMIELEAARHELAGQSGYVHCPLDADAIDN